MQFSSIITLLATLVTYTAAVKSGKAAVKSGKCGLDSYLNAYYCIIDDVVSLT